MAVSWSYIRHLTTSLFLKLAIRHFPYLDFFSFVSYFNHFFLETISDGSAVWQVTPRHLTSHITPSNISSLWHLTPDILDNLPHQTPYRTPARILPDADTDARRTYWPLLTIYSPPTDSHISLGCIMVVFSAKWFRLFYLRVLRQISTSTVTLMANEVSVSFASFSNTVHTLRQRGVSQLLHETFISPLFHLKSSSVNLKNYRIYSILYYGHIHLA